MDVVRGTFGGEYDVDDKCEWETIRLAPEPTLAMNPGLKHRGMSYLTGNIRFFIAFLVGKSIGSDFTQTYNLY